MRTLITIAITLASSATLACTHPRAGLYMNPSDCSMPHYLPLPSYEPLPQHQQRKSYQEQYYQQMLYDYERALAKPALNPVTPERRNLPVFNQHYDPRPLLERRYDR